jgi:hypothetical protein
MATYRAYLVSAPGQLDRAEELALTGPARASS